MKIIALEKEHRPASAVEYAPYLKAEARKVWELQQAGIIREIHFRQDRSSAVLILECDNNEAAQSLLNTLPLVQAGLIEFELIPLVPYPGYARLFAAKP